MVPHVYAFRPMSAADLPMVRRWLGEPHVVQWWGDPNEQFALLAEDLDHPAMDQFIVAMEERPFAYLQCYDPSAWPNNGLGLHPNGTRGIDQFIGEENMVGRGHGSALIRSFVDGLLESGAPRAATDPDPAQYARHQGLRKGRISQRSPGGHARRPRISDGP